jgi:holliday junction DNA helicase RuvB
VPRPAPRFHGFIGHQETVELLRRQLAGALARKEPFPHALFMGPSGSGKTRLARTLAAEYGTTLLDGMGYNTRLDLSQKLGSLKLGDFLLVDESHRLGALEQELLCEAIDRLSVPNLSPADDKAAPAGGRLTLQPWTLLLATDQPGRLLDALQKRVVVQVELGFYAPAELKEVVEELATQEGLLLSPQAARVIATASGGLPRRARLHLRNLRLYIADSEKRQLGVPEVREFLAAFGIDEAGLGRMERRYLRELADLGVASLESLSLLLGTDPAYLKHNVEAHLVKLRLVKILPSGRRLTDRGRRYLGDGAPAREADGEEAGQ